LSVALPPTTRKTQASAAKKAVNSPGYKKGGLTAFFYAILALNPSQPCLGSYQFNSNLETATERCFVKLHIAPVLTAHFKQAVGDLAQ
jgi:hypothetical protein